MSTRLALPNLVFDFEPSNGSCRVWMRGERARGMPAGTALTAHLSAVDLQAIATYLAAHLPPKEAAT